MLALGEGQCGGERRGGRRRGLGGYGGFTAHVNVILALALLVLALGMLPASAAAVRILALGDSLTAGYGLPPGESFPAQLQAKLAADGFPAEVINAGVSGDTTAGGLARLNWALGDKPQYALVELGANDMLRGLDPGEAYANLDKILARLKTAQVQTLLLGMRAAANWGPAYRHSFDAIYPKLAAKWRVPLYPFFLAGVALDPKLTQADGLHPNAQGVAVIVARLAPAVERLIAPAAVRR